MKTATEFCSPEIARKMAKLFGARAKTVTLEMKYARPVRAFVRKIDQAHKQVANGNLVFG